MASYVMRIIGTFLGLVLGLLVWYIANARGNGNPYTFALLLAIFLLPVVFLRVHCPPRQMPLFLL